MGRGKHSWAFGWRWAAVLAALLLGVACSGDANDNSSSPVCGDEAVCEGDDYGSDNDDYAVGVIAEAEAENDWPEAGGPVDHYLPYAAGVNMGISQGTTCDGHAYIQGALDFTVSGPPSDYESSHGLEAVASVACEVVKVVDNVSGYAAKSYGNHVFCRNIDGTYSLYAHLLYGGVHVKKGDTLCRGQSIGVIGSTGTSTADHLHYELRLAQNGQRIDPSFVELPNAPSGCWACKTYDHAGSDCYVSKNVLDCGGVCSTDPGSANISSPVPNATIDGAFVMSGSAQDLDGIVQVTVTVDTLPDCKFIDVTPGGAAAYGFSIAVDPSAPSCQLSGGQHTLGVWIKDGCDVAKQVATLDFTYQPNGGCTTCAPGTQQCSGSTVQVCQPDGCGWVNQQTCSCGCSGGSCVSQLCSPGSTQCNGNSVQVCQPDGCGWANQQTCSCGCSGGSCDSCACCESTSSTSIGVWQPTYTPDTNCTCTSGNTDCHSLYVARVLAINGNQATIEFQKSGGGVPSSTVQYWVVVLGEAQMSCLNLSSYVERQSGFWNPSNGNLIVTVDIWPSTTSCEQAGAGQIKRLGLITGDSGAATSKIWFTETPLTFTKNSCP